MKLPVIVKDGSNFSVIKSLAIITLVGLLIWVLRPIILNSGTETQTPNKKHPAPLEQARTNHTRDTGTKSGHTLQKPNAADQKRIDKQQAINEAHVYYLKGKELFVTNTLESCLAWLASLAGESEEIQDAASTAMSRYLLNLDSSKRQAAINQILEYIGLPSAAYQRTYMAAAEFLWQSDPKAVVPFALQIPESEAMLVDEWLMGFIDLEQATEFFDGLNRLSSIGRHTRSAKRFIQRIANDNEPEVVCDWVLKNFSNSPDWKAILRQTLFSTSLKDRAKTGAWASNHLSSEEAKGVQHLWNK